jgi:DNA-binding beta-propeller fold protein YncE
MNQINHLLRILSVVGISVLAGNVHAQDSTTPYKILNITQTNGTGGIDYVIADSQDRRLYIPRGNQIMVFDLDTYQCIGAIPGTGGHGAVVDPKTHHGFSSSSPISMFDAVTLDPIKKITPLSGPDGILFEPATERVYILSHGTPQITVIDPKEGTVVGSVDIGGAAEQAVSDLNGHVYVCLEDKAGIAVVDANTLKLTATYSLQGKASSPAGLAIDVKNHILFAMCRPATCVILSADDGKIITTLPLGGGSDGGGFNPDTMEAFSSTGNANGGGLLTIIKETSPTSFEVEQNLPTKSGAKCCTLDSKTGHIILSAIEPLPASAPADAAAVAATPAAAPDTNAPAAGQRRGGRGRGGPGILDAITVGR